jgi:hypothetical protein
MGRRSMRSRLARSAVPAAFALTLLASGSVVARHAGAVADCGAAGEFIVRATRVNDSLDAPPPHGVVLFEGGAALTIFDMTINGATYFARADTGTEKNSLQETICSFTVPGRGLFVVTGLLVGAPAS